MFPRLFSKLLIDPRYESWIVLKSFDCVPIISLFHPRGDG